MTVFDQYGFWMFENDGILDADMQEEHQKQLCELMNMYQIYRGIVKEQSIVLKGSIIACQYGTRHVVLDLPTDHGIYRGKLPLLTCRDCLPENIYNFGSCLCPEDNYQERLPMTIASLNEGEVACKSPKNTFHHACVPLVDKDYGWEQIDGELLAGVVPGYAPILMDNAVLICQYGGIIRILEAKEETEVIDENPLVTMEQMNMFGFEITDEDLKKLNQLLEENEVTNKGSIALFMATCGHESGMGKDKLENGTNTEFEAGGYTTETRGAGYIQVTGNDQLLFYEYLSKEAPSNRAQDIADNYAWEASVWEWAVCKKGAGVIMNDYVTTHGYGENVFLITQYFINSYLPSTHYPYFDSDLSEIRKGAKFSYDPKAIWVDYKGRKFEGVLYINERNYRLPKNYEDRLLKYEAAIECFVGSENEEEME